MSNGSYIEYLYRNPPPGWKLEHPSTYHYFSFEAIDTRWWLQFGMSHWYYSIYASVSYVIAIFAIQWYMKDRPAFQLKTPLFLWNLCLGLYSIIGFCRYFPAFVSIFSKPNGFYNSICARSDLTIPFSYWTILFVGSKMVELGDTFFILLKKKKLMFLQWFHHLATMITTWILVPYMEPVLRWYAFLNYGVHSLMYPYFALKTIGVKIPAVVANLITTLQLGQMIIGLFVNLLSMYYYESGADCYRFPTSIKVFGLLYGSFFILFGDLFYNLVVKGGRKQRDGKKID